MEKNKKIPQWHVWDLKKATAEFLVPRLILYKEWVESDKMMAIPNWVRAEVGDVEDTELNGAWASIIGEMIDGFVVFTNNFDSALSNEERIKREERALYLFSKYYSHLWD